MQRQVCNSNSSDEVFNDIPEVLCVCSNMFRFKHDYSCGDGEEAEQPSAEAASRLLLLIGTIILSVVHGCNTEL